MEEGQLVLWKLLITQVQEVVSNDEESALLVLGDRASLYVFVLLCACLFVNRWSEGISYLSVKIFDQIKLWTLLTATPQMLLRDAGATLLQGERDAAGWAGRCRVSGTLQGERDAAGKAELCRVSGMLQGDWDVAGWAGCCRVSGTRLYGRRIPVRIAESCSDALLLMLFLSFGRMLQNLFFFSKLFLANYILNSKY